MDLVRLFNVVSVISRTSRLRSPAIQSSSTVPMMLPTMWSSLILDGRLLKSRVRLSLGMMKSCSISRWSSPWRTDHDDGMLLLFRNTSWRRDCCKSLNGFMGPDGSTNLSILTFLNSSTEMLTPRKASLGRWSK